jgi:glucose/arabinose dehydrogenase
MKGSIALVIVGALFGSGLPAYAQLAKQGDSQLCSEDNGGITLSPGFCATIFADKLGHVRQMAVAPDGALYVNTWSGVYYNNDTPPSGGFLIALQDTHHDGRADKTERFGPTFADGDHGGTGIAIYKNYVYAEMNDRIVRYALPSTGIAPSARSQTVVRGMPLGGDHPMHPFGIDARGNMYIDMGSATNSCQGQNRMPNVPGGKPCRELETRGGTWYSVLSALQQGYETARGYPLIPRAGSSSLNTAAINCGRTGPSFIR